MSHTVEDGGWKLHYNSDLSGNIHAVSPSGCNIYFPAELVKKILIKKVIE